MSPVKCTITQRLHCIWWVTVQLVLPWASSSWQATTRGFGPEPRRGFMLCRSSSELEGDVFPDDVEITFCAAFTMLEVDLYTTERRCTCVIMSFAITFSLCCGVFAWVSFTLPPSYLPIVLHKVDRMDASWMILKLVGNIGQAGRVCTAPRVNGLVCVADDK